jgi:signal peptidase I
MGTITHTQSHRSKRITAFLSVVQVVVIAAFVLVAVLSFGTRIPLLARLGVNFFAVTSGSMEPAIATGSLLYVAAVPPDSLKQGDIITYSKGDPQSGKSAVVTHRIHEIEKQTRDIPTGEGDQAETKTRVDYIITTKGDANTDPDNYTVLPTEIIGVYKWHIPQLGYVTAFSQTQQGFFLMVLLPAAILIVWEVISIILHFKKEFAIKSNKEVEALKAELARVKNEHA